MSDDDLFADSEFVEFPGYEQQPTAAAGGVAPVKGLKPIKVGPVTVKVSYKGYHVVVDVHVDPIPAFGAKDFRTLELYPGHWSDQDTIHYGAVNLASITLNLKVEPSTQLLYVRVEGKGVGITFKKVNKRFNYSTFRFADLSKLAHPKWATPQQVQSAIDSGTWMKAPRTRAALTDALHRNDASTKSTLQNTLAMMGGASFVPDVQGYIGQFANNFPKPGGDPGPVLIELGCLMALGISGDIANVVSGGLGGGIYVTKDDFGIYGQAEAALGWMFGAELSLNYAIYWPTAEKTAFENFNGQEWFVRIGGAAGIGAGGTLSFDPPLHPVGLTLSASTGAEFSIGAGIAATSTHSFVKH